MLSAGKNIKQRKDKLIKLDIKRLFFAIKNPKPEIKDLLGQLRILSHIDTNGYKNLKTSLPYVVPSLFNPPYRRGENFGSAEHLILDIDHLSEYDIAPEELKLRLQKDERIELMFVSPSENGLKIFFRLQEKCFDSAKYSLFYKNFADNFAKKHDLGGVLDRITSDVTRACFISYDENVFFNDDVIKIKVDDFSDFEDIFTLKDANKIIKDDAKKLVKIEDNQQIDIDIFKEIKLKLNPNLQKKVERKKNAFVPEQLNEIMGALENHIISYNVDIKEVKSINYGKKIIISYKMKVAEVNVFYGKRGFSVVRSPKSGTDRELMELLYKIIVEFFND